MLRHDLYDVDRRCRARRPTAWSAPSAGRLPRSSRARGCCSAGDRRRRRRRHGAARPSPRAAARPAAAPGRPRGSTRCGGRRCAAVETCSRASTPGRRGRSSCEAVLRDGAARPGPAGRASGCRAPAGLVDADGGRSSPAARCRCELGGRQIGVLRGDVAARNCCAEVAAAAARCWSRWCGCAASSARALREVESSRARLLQAGYEERRRLERDLHDGAQQRLVSLGMALRLAQRHLDDGTVDVNGLLDQGVAELGTAVAELRQIAHGLRPSSLDDGLDPALRRLATHRADRRRARRLPRAAARRRRHHRVLRGQRGR